MIIVTDPAWDKLRHLLDDEAAPGVFLRVAVRPGGCSGFAYEMFFDTAAGQGDHTVTACGVEVHVDPASAALLEGATLDFNDGLIGSGFTIRNPNASRTCGCGQSFS